MAGPAYFIFLCILLILRITFTELAQAFLTLVHNVQAGTEVGIDELSGLSTNEVCACSVFCNWVGLSVYMCFWFTVFSSWGERLFVSCVEWEKHLEFLNICICLLTSPCILHIWLKSSCGGEAEEEGPLWKEQLYCLI